MVFCAVENGNPSPNTLLKSDSDAHTDCGLFSFSLFTGDKM